MTIKELFDELGKIRDLNIKTSEAVKTEGARQYFHGQAVAYDTVRGWVFEMIGEEEASGNV